MSVNVGLLRNSTTNQRPRRLGARRVAVRVGQDRGLRRVFDMRNREKLCFSYMTNCRGGIVAVFHQLEIPLASKSKPSRAKTNGIEGAAEQATIAPNIADDATCC
jgi:hypothetical protein